MWWRLSEVRPENGRCQEMCAILITVAQIREKNYFKNHEIHVRTIKVKVILFLFVVCHIPTVDCHSRETVYSLQLFWLSAQVISSIYFLIHVHDFLHNHSPGLTFDIYEGQITALLGHSGAGKSTLMNILCGICPPTDGSATIYGSPVAEIADGLEMKQLVGICPQFNIIFDVLTVEEHLRIFAAIKGIRPADTDAEVML